MTESNFIKLIKYLTIIPILFGVLLLVDSILPPVTKQEIVKESKTQVVGSRRRLDNGKIMFYTYTKNFSFLTNKQFKMNDKVQVQSTRIFGIPQKVYFYGVGDDKTLYYQDVDYSLSNGFIVPPLILLVLSVITIISKKDIAIVGAKAFLTLLVFGYLAFKVLFS